MLLLMMMMVLMTRMMMVVVMIIVVMCVDHDAAGCAAADVGTRPGSRDRRRYYDCGERAQADSERHRHHQPASRQQRALRIGCSREHCAGLLTCSIFSV